jgi:syntaxin-binding protein 1
MKMLRVSLVVRCLQTFDHWLSRVLDIEQIESRRPMNPETDAVYILSPLPHIVDCLMADLERRRYKRSFLVWISSKIP